METEIKVFVYVKTRNKMYVITNTQIKTEVNVLLRRAAP